MANDDIAHSRTSATYNSGMQSWRPPETRTSGSSAGKWASVPERTLERALRPDGARILLEEARKSGIATPRELEMVELLTRGLSRRELEEALTISFRYYEGHMANLIWKLSQRPGGIPGLEDEPPAP
jgi:ATP/maltotriose-dependent transcriptional regulator MalT